MTDFQFRVPFGGLPQTSLLAQFGWRANGAPSLTGRQTLLSMAKVSLTVCIIWNRLQSW